MKSASAFMSCFGVVTTKKAAHSLQSQQQQQTHVCTAKIDNGTEACQELNNENRKVL